jgi:LacI family transcriptional regulator
MNRTHGGEEKVRISNKITIKHIAEIAGVSFSTVGKALRNDPVVNVKTKEKILKIAAEIRYYPNLLAKGLKNKTTKTVGIILNDLKNPFYSDIYKVIGDILNERDYTMLLCDSNYDESLERKNIITMLSKGVDGVIISPVNENSENVQLILESGLKAVFIDSRLELPGINYVYVNHEKAATLAAEYLIDMGHRRILLLNGPQNLSSSQHFLKGYRHAISARGIEPAQELITFNEISIECGARTLKNLYEKKKTGELNFTAVMSLSDLLAIGVYEAAKEARIRLPEDLSVVGYDNIFATNYIVPPLTTIHQPKKRTGVQSITILLDSISSSSFDTKKIVIDPVLVERESVRRVLPEQ